MQYLSDMIRKSNEQNIGEVIKGLFKSYHIDSKVYEVQIKEVWEKVMGKTMMRYTTDIRLKDGKLSLYVESASLKQELMFNKETIIERLNTEFGERVVNEVIIR
jgi:Dna[CI] antecedent, DciA